MYLYPVVIICSNGAFGERKSAQVFMLGRSDENLNTIYISLTKREFIYLEVIWLKYLDRQKHGKEYLESLHRQGSAEVPLSLA